MGDQVFSTVEDFVFDATFRDWILNNNSVHKSYWENWLKANANKQHVVQHAKSIVYALSAQHTILSGQEIEGEIRSILHRMSAETTDEAGYKVGENIDYRLRKRRLKSMWLRSVAAAVIAILLIVYFTRPNPIEKADLAIQTSKSSEFPLPITEKVNHFDSSIVVELPDHSRVLLAANSKLSYTDTSFATRREVYLTGEAFFDIRKIPSAPFLVFTQNMVTKVLGTSFSVKEFPNDRQATVLVKTGKVSVYRHENFSTNDADSKQLNGLIVVPNQQVIYNLNTKQLTKDIIQEPVVLQNTPKRLFAFHLTPLKDVFATLERAYGIVILYDESMISSCSLSVTMDDESFYEKLDLICKAINARYESIDGSIFITSQGCK